MFTRATFGLFGARHRDWRRRPTVTRHPNRCRGGCRLKWNMSQCLLRSDTVIYEAATHCPVDELVLTFHLVYRHSSFCQFPARLYLGHLRTPHHWSQRSLTEQWSCKHIVNLSGVNGSQADGRHMAPTNRSCKHSLKMLIQLGSATIHANPEWTTPVRIVNKIHKNP